MTKEELQEIREELKGIVHYPWELDHDDTFVASSKDHQEWIVQPDNETTESYWIESDWNNHKANCRFIAKAPERIENLLNEVEKYRDLAERISKEQSSNLFMLIEVIGEAAETMSFYANPKYYNDDNPHELSSMHEDTCTIKMDEGSRAIKWKKYVETAFINHLSKENGII